MHPILESYFRFIKRVTLSPGEDSVIGVDMGPSLCRAVELSRKQDSFEVVGWVSVPVDGVDEKAALNKVLEKLGASARTKPLITAVGGKGTLIRHVDMPRMGAADLRKAFVIEADKYFPFPKETVYSDCFILDPRSKDKRMAVLVAAVKKDVVDPRLKIFKDCGIVPEALTMSSSAVANAFRVFPPPTCTAQDIGGKAVAVVDIGESVTNLMILSDGIPRFTRDIFIGVADIWRRMANVTGLSIAEVKGLTGGGSPALSGVAVDLGRAEEMRQSIDAILNNIVSEIRLSFDYFNTEKNMPVGRICLIGDGIFVPEVESVFMSHFDIPFVKWNPADMLVVAADANRDGFVQEGRRMAVALGLALSHYD